MAPSVQALEKPEDVKALLRKEADDCTSCRVVGCSAFFGLAGYSLFSGLDQLEKNRAAIEASKYFGMRSRKGGIYGIAAGLAYMGVWRAMN